MAKPTIILATSNGIGMGHLARATAVALELLPSADPIILSLAGGIAELPSATGVRCEYIPGVNRGWIKRNLWDSYLQSRLLAVAYETGANVIAFDGVVPYSGFIATKISNPKLKLIWIRRGLWKKNALRFALPFQSSLMDFIIEPGDFARSIDKGPTSRRRDSYLTSPVSLFNTQRAKPRSEARSILGLDPIKPAVLVQLGTGDNDMNQKMSAALTGLLAWKDLQVVLTKNPVDEDGKSLVPEGLTVNIVRYFPLADLLYAFDGAVAATGYNSVHELLPAQIPTVFISNIRGTDDQDARARWCNDNGYALRANHADLVDITQTVARLIDDNLRESLRTKCREIGSTSGGTEIAKLLMNIALDPKEKNENFFKRLIRIFGVDLLWIGTFLYQKLRPQSHAINVSNEPVLYSSETDLDFLRSAIKGNRRFEQLIVGSSERYLEVRRTNAEHFYNL